MKLLFAFTGSIILLFSFQYSFAGHPAGGNIKYKSLGGNKYYIEAHVTRDCAGAGYSSPTISINATCTGSSTATYNLNLVPFISPSTPIYGNSYSPISFISGTTYVAVEDISDACDDALNPAKSTYTRCRYVSGIVSGFTLYTYSGTITLGSCSEWVLSFGTAGTRNGANTNMRTSFPWYQTKLNSKDFPNNSSPNFGNERRTVFNACVGQNGEYHLGSNDLDNDFLTYKFVCPLATATTCGIYNSGFSASAPVPGAKLDTLTGRFTFKPNTAGTRFIAVLINEYDRCTKKWKGSTRREIRMTTMACTNKNPTYTYGIHKVTGGATKIDSFNLIVKAGQSFTIEDTLYDPDATDTLRVFTNNLSQFTGSSLKLTQLAKNKIHFKFTWSPPSYLTGVKFLHLTISDDRCSLPGKKRIAYGMDFSPQLSISNNSRSRRDTVLLMKGDTLNLSSGGRGLSNWNSFYGDSIHWTGSSKNIWGDTSASDTNSSIRYRPLKNTKIAATAKVKNSCSNTFLADTIFIKIIPTFQAFAKDTSICANVDSVQLEVTTDSNYTFTYLWNSNGGKLNSSSFSKPSVSGFLAGFYSVTVTSNHGGSRTASLWVSIKRNVPNLYISSFSDSICAGGSVLLEANVLNPRNACEVVQKRKTLKTVQSHDSLNVFNGTSVPNDYPNPFSNKHNSSRQLYLYLDSNLKAIGLKKGVINSVAFFVDSVSSDSIPKTFSSYTVKLGCTNLNSLSSWILSGMSQVALVSKQSVKLGWNTIELDSGYYWDGSSNLALEICYDNGVSNIAKSFTAMQNVSYFGCVTRFDFSGVCNSQLLSFANRTRVPVVKFGFSADLDTSNIRYSWSPSSSLSSSNTVKTIASPTSTTTYSIIVSDSLNICVDTVYKTISIVTGKLDAGKDTAICANNQITFSPNVTPKNNGASFTWFPAASFINNKIQNAIFNGSTSQQVWLNYKDTLSCNLSDTIMVTLNPIPSPFFTVPNRICETSSINPLIPRTTGGTFSGLGVLSTNFNATDPKVKPSLNTPNGVIIKHSISKLNCNADTSIMVLVYPQFDTVYSGIREFCETDALEILTTRHSGGAWTGPGVSAKSFNPALAGAGSLTIKVDSTGFCGNSANYQFLVSKMPDHDFPDTIYGCNNKAAILDAGNNGSAYLWNTNDTSKK